MSFRVGDPIFTYKGAPAEVLKKDEVTQEFKVDTDPQKVLESFRHGYLKGLPEETRNEFNAIMDDVKSMEDIKKRIGVLQEKIATYEHHESKDMRLLAGYLKGELMHTMTSSNVTPRYYEIPFYKAI